MSPTLNDMALWREQCNRNMQRNNLWFLHGTATFYYQCTVICNLTKLTTTGCKPFAGSVSPVPPLPSVPPSLQRVPFTRQQSLVKFNRFISSKKNWYVSRHVGYPEHSSIPDPASEATCVYKVWKCMTSWDVMWWHSMDITWCLVML